jgi:putative peptidoglycan lipid II flippase
MWRAVATVGFWTLASRLLGFARDILIAATLGAGPVADAFFVALKLPNLFRRLFGEGAFNAAFVPAFTAVAAADGTDAARRLAGQVASVMILVLGLIVLAAEFGMPALMHGFAPGFAATPARFALAVALTRITFPYLMLICLASLLAGVLNAIGRFAVAAATPVLFNLTCIAALLGLRHVLPTAGHALALGVLVAGVLQLAWLAIACARLGWAIHPARPRATPAMRLVLRRLGPGLVGAGVTQLNLAVGVVIASLLPPGTVSVLYYADRVNQLPLGAIGVAVGTALLPALSRDIGRGAFADAVARLNRAIELALTLALPAALALLLLAAPIMQVLFGRGAFSPGLVRLSAAALAVYAVGLPGAVLCKLLAPACFARGDTTTPVWIGVAAVAANAALGLGLMRPLGMLAPAAAASFAATLNAGLLALVLRRRGALVADAQLRRFLPRLLAASLAMAAVLALALMPLHHLFVEPGITRWAALTLLVGIGLALFAAAGQALGAFDLRRLRHSLRGQTTGP